MLYYKYISKLISITKQTVYSIVIFLKNIKLDVTTYSFCAKQVYIKPRATQNIKFFIAIKLVFF